MLRPDTQGSQARLRPDERANLSKDQGLDTGRATRARALWNDALHLMEASSSDIPSRGCRAMRRPREHRTWGLLAMKPVSNTAFYCCGIRMRDAESRRPVCGDQYAKRFMDARGLEIFRQFGGESGPNVSNVARHRYIDDFLRAELARDPNLRL